MNPMYETRTDKSDFHPYSQMNHCKQHTTTGRQLRGLWCAFSVLLIVAIALLAIVIYMLVWIVPGKEPFLSLDLGLLPVYAGCFLCEFIPYFFH
jgi:hypothetical protein